MSSSPDAPIILSTYIKLVLHATGTLIILFVFYQLIRSCTQEIQDRYDLELRGKSKIATQVFGELMNGFVEPLTLKAMVIICLLVFGFFIISSFVVL
ncbi:hypothetical protein MFLAVUS_008482 [Mucor flavus]|uniref:Brl1/Brr6 domain-containing protein n=1 Tax=Mucor flavus TaxID=439312 RepID=A0ABP9Z776_9FUNG